MKVFNENHTHEMCTVCRYGNDDEDDGGVSAGPGRFRSRFLRPDDDDDVGGSSRKSMHEGEGSNDYSKVERVKVIDTEDASRGPLSGCIRLADSSRIIQRLKVTTHPITITTTKWTLLPLFGLQY